MFRELLRKNSRLTEDVCIEILTNEKRGVLCVNGEGGYPYGMPMNHYYNSEDGCIYFHCGKKGHRLDCLHADSKASFCVYDEGYKNSGEWALHYKSVIVFGTVEIIGNMEQIIQISEKLSRKFTNDTEYIQKEIKTSAHETLLLKLTPEHICGKKVVES